MISGFIAHVRQTDMNNSDAVYDLTTQYLALIGRPIEPNVAKNILIASLAEIERNNKKIEAETEEKLIEDCANFLCKIHLLPECAEKFKFSKETQQAILITATKLTIQQAINEFKPALSQPLNIALNIALTNAILNYPLENNTEAIDPFRKSTTEENCCIDTRLESSCTTVHTKEKGKEKEDKRTFAELLERMEKEKLAETAEKEKRRTLEVTIESLGAKPKKSLLSQVIFRESLVKNFVVDDEEEKEETIIVDKTPLPHVYVFPKGHGGENVVIDNKLIDLEIIKNYSKACQNYLNHLERAKKILALLNRTDAILESKIHLLKNLKTIINIENEPSPDLKSKIILFRTGLKMGASTSTLRQRRDGGFKTFVKEVGVFAASIFGFGKRARHRFFDEKFTEGSKFIKEIKRIGKGESASNLDESEDQDKNAREDNLNSMRI